MSADSGHLLHVGFPKAGSTTLQAWFAEHPQLAFSVNGLAGFYAARDIVEEAIRFPPAPLWRVTSLEGFTTPPSIAGASEELAALPPGSWGEARARACAILADVFPDSTVLIVTRGFRAAMFSGYSQYVRRAETLAFAELVGSFAGRALLQGADHYDYDGTVRLYRDTFGTDRVIVLPFELLRDDSAAFAAILVERLGLDAARTPPMRWLNEALTPAELAWVPAISRWVQTAATPLGRRLGGHLLGTYTAHIGGRKVGALVRAMQRVAPREGPTPVDVPNEVVDACRGRAAELGRLPVYAPYAAEYLNDGR
jgi:hypothetical protein